MTVVKLEHLPKPAASLQEFLAERTTGLGGSDAAVVCGLSKWKAPLQLWMEKRGLMEDIGEEPPFGYRPMYWGNLHEPALQQTYTNRTGRRVYTGNPDVDGAHRMPMLRHPEHDFMIAHLDGLVLDDAGKVVGGLECKSSSQYKASEWGEDGSDVVPREYIVQCQHNLAVSGLPWMDLIVLIGGNDDRLYRIERDDKLIANLIIIEQRFWEGVQSGQEPEEIDGSDASAKYLAARYPADDGTEMQSTLEIDKEVHSLAQATIAKRDAETDMELHKNRIKQAMGEASVLIGPDYKISYKKAANSTSIDWEKIARYIAADCNLTDADLQELIEANTTVKIGSRRFTPSGPLFPRKGH